MASRLITRLPRLAKTTLPASNPIRSRLCSEGVYRSRKVCNTPRDRFIARTSPDSPGRIPACRPTYCAEVPPGQDVQPISRRSPRMQPRVIFTSHPKRCQYVDVIQVHPSGQPPRRGPPRTIRRHATESNRHDDLPEPQVSTTAAGSDLRSTLTTPNTHGKAWRLHGSDEQRAANLPPASHRREQPTSCEVYPPES